MPLANPSITDRDAGVRSPFLLLPGFRPDAVGFATRTTGALLLPIWSRSQSKWMDRPPRGFALLSWRSHRQGWRCRRRPLAFLERCWAAASGWRSSRRFRRIVSCCWRATRSGWGCARWGRRLLRDFRSYGAALSGYTAGIIAICAIDTPDSALLTTLNRVAAMAIGIAAVFVVNNLFAGTNAVDSLEAELRERTDAITSTAIAALEGRLAGDDLATLHVRLRGGGVAHGVDVRGAGVAGRTGSQQRCPYRHRVAAGHGIAARDLGRELGPTHLPPSASTWIAVVAAIRTPTAPQPVAPWPTRPGDALILQCADELLIQTRRARIAQGCLGRGQGRPARHAATG